MAYTQTLRFTRKGVYYKFAVDDFVQIDGIARTLDEAEAILDRCAEIQQCLT